MKSGKIIFNLNESFSEYKNNENNFQDLCEKPISTCENEEDADPFEKENGERPSRVLEANNKLCSHRQMSR